MHVFQPLGMDQLEKALLLEQMHGIIPVSAVLLFNKPMAELTTVGPWKASFRKMLMICTALGHLTTLSTGGMLDQYTKNGTK